jgi:carbonic anhydrase/acetyltransferase-like protein (isoleucine patch superfamily)
MKFAHAGTAPRIDAAAWIAPDATVVGDVEIGPGVRVMHGARVIGEAGGKITIGRNVIIMENAVVRAGPRHPCRIGDHCLIGPNAHVTGCTVEEQVFIATGAAIFHAAHVGKGTVVRVQAIVHVKTKLAPNSVVPIGWVAVGGRMFSPDQHEALSVVLKEQNFSETVYGIDPATPDRMIEVTKKLSEALGAHAMDRLGT